MRFLLSVTFNICVYALLGMALNLPLGYSGMLLLCGASFFGVGAYTYAIVSYYSFGFLEAFLIAAFLGASIASVIGILTVRLRGDDFAIATLAFQIIVNAVFSNWIGLTGGPYGQRDIPPPRIGSWTLESNGEYAALAIVMVALVVGFSAMLVNLPYGRSLIAVRDSELGATTIGKNPIYYRLSAIIICGIIASATGAIYASQITYIDPLSFGFDEMMLILAVVIIGGAGTLYGPLVGALIIAVLPEILKSFALDDATAGAVRQIILGAVLVLLMHFRPQGIAGGYRFSSNT